ncbi:MAG: AsmA family protein [Bauldia sp.]|nr:AsmA family protein [Bauldia sp.]
MGPYLIDWNGFRTTFERRASEILGQPVRIVGDADLTLLPVPSLTFEHVEIGEAEGRPMMTVDRVAMKLEFIAFFSGRIAVTEMTIERPVAEITVDDAGTVDWVIRPGAGVTLDPGRVSLAGVTITDGAISYFDARTNAAVRLTDINTSLVEAPSLAGPWRLAGNLVCRDAPLCGDGLPVDFSVTTGRAAADGSLGIGISLIPADAALAGTLRTDGTVSGTGEFRYAGTFRFDKFAVPSAATPASGPAGTLRPAWRIGGRFDLGADGLALSDFLFDPGQGTVTLAGNASLVFGRDARFDADIATRQIDLDTMIGEGPANPIAVADAGTDLLDRLAALALPDIPGRISISVPVIIVSGAALQDLAVDLAAVPADPAAGTPGRWEIAELSVVLPGASALSVTGIVTAGETLAFDGAIRLASESPAALTAWWRGANAATTRLAPFVLAFEGTIGADTVAAAEIAVDIGPSSARGAFEWMRDPDSGTRRLEATFAAGTFDLDQLAALGELLAGPGFAATDLIADDATIAFTADELRRGDVRMNDVAIDVAIGPDLVVVNRFVVGDLAGARFELASGRFDRSGETPRGALEATLDAATLDGIVALARQVAPESEFTAWLARSARYLTPARLGFRLEAQAAGGPSYQATIEGTAADAVVRVAATLSGTLDDWDRATATLAIDLASPDTVRLARQLGIAVETVANAGPAQILIEATGVPATGMTARIDPSQLAGLRVSGSGQLRFDRTGTFAFQGPIRAQGDLGPLARMAGVVLPGMEAGVSAVIEGVLRAGDERVSLAFGQSQSSIGTRSLDGELALTRADENLALTGGLALEEVDLGWLLALPVGTDPSATGIADGPWPRTPFPGPILDGITVDIEVETARLALGTALTLDNAVLQVTARQDGGSIELKSASLAGGAVAGFLAATIVDGQASVDGQLRLDRVPIEAIIWRREGQPVADGNLTLDATFTGLGRSPAGVIATLAGSGNFTLDEGVFHFFNPNAFNLILERAEAGPPLGDIALRDAFTDFLDAGDLPVGALTTPFEIAAGVLSLDNAFVSVDGTNLSARVDIDLNRLVLDSRWAFDLAGDATERLRRGVDILFAGPMADPSRTVNVTALTSYLRVESIRRADETTANALEIERFLRMIERTNADREAAEAAVPAPAEEAPAAIPAELFELPPAAPAIGGPVPPAPVP